MSRAFLKKGEEAEELEVLDEFRAWVWAEMLPKHQTYLGKHERGNGRKSK